MHCSHHCDAPRRLACALRGYLVYPGGAHRKKGTVHFKTRQQLVRTIHNDSTARPISPQFPVTGDRPAPHPPSMNSQIHSHMNSQIHSHTCSTAYTGAKTKSVLVCRPGTTQWGTTDLAGIDATQKGARAERPLGIQHRTHPRRGSYGTSPRSPRHSSGWSQRCRSDR